VIEMPLSSIFRFFNILCADASCPINAFTEVSDLNKLSRGLAVFVNEADPYDKVMRLETNDQQSFIDLTIFNNWTIYIDYINRESVDGEVLAWVSNNHEKIPAIVRKNNLVVFNFNPESIIHTLLNESHYIQHLPLIVRLPLHYHYIPGFIRRIVLQVLTTYSSSKNENSFPDWPSDFSVDKLRLLVRNFYYALNKQNIPRLSNNVRLVALSHDVDSAQGFKNISKIVEVERKMGVRSTFNIVPNRYAIDFNLLRKLEDEGFEIGIHGHDHSGRLPFKPAIVQQKLLKDAVKSFQSLDVRGFRSPSLFRTPYLFEALEKVFEYDSSVPDTENYTRNTSFNGVATCFPYYRGKLLEIPLSLPQDAVLLALRKNTNEMLKIWINKLDAIQTFGGMGVLNTHPEPHFTGNKKMLALYEKFILHLKEKNYQICTMIELCRYWKSHLSGQSSG